MISALSNNLAQMYWRSPNLWPLAAAGALFVAIVVFSFYPAQLSLVRWPWRGILPGLRIAALICVALALPKPVVMRPASAEERGAILMLVDRSRSMSIVDNSRTHPQLVALADALGKLKPEVRGDASTRLSAGVERLRAAAASVRAAQDDLDYARVSGRDIQFRHTRVDEAAARFGTEAAALVQKASALSDADELVAQLAKLAQPPESESHDGWRKDIPRQVDAAMAAVAQYQNDSDRRLYESDLQVQSACNEVAQLSRFALVERAMLRQGGVVSAAASQAKVLGFAIASDVEPIELQSNGQTAAQLNAAPDRDESDLAACVARAAAANPARAIVLFSDGRQVGADTTGVSALTQAGVPVFTVSAAAELPPRDVSFSSVVAPASVFSGQSFTVKADIRHDGFEAGFVDVHCKIEDQPEQTRTVALLKDKPAIAEFPFRLNRDGVQRISLWITPLPGEASVDNNRAERWIKVVKDRMKVLLVANSPTWDFQYLRHALGALPEIQLREITLDPANPRLYIPPPEILQQDVIVLFDVPTAAMDEKHWQAVQKMAQSTGGSVILVAGDSLPGDYYKYSSSADLLPFKTPFRSFWNVWPGDEPSFHFVPTADGEPLDFLRLPKESESSDSDTSDRRWEQLPGCFRFLELPDPHNKDWKPQAKALLVEEESHVPVLTEMRLGAGRAFFVGINETWRWRLRVGGRFQEHFWRELVQHASETPYFAHSTPEGLELDADKVSAEPGQTIHVRARLAGDIEESTNRLSVEILQGSRAIAEIPLAPVGTSASGRFTASFDLKQPGEYQVRWTHSDKARRPRQVSIPVHVGATSEAEMADLSGDRKNLRDLAEATGGEFLTMEQVGRLPERLIVASESHARFVEVRLWDSPLLFILVVGCLGTEWALRKRFGLA